MSRDPVKLFLSYSQADAEYRAELLVHLKPLASRVRVWHDQDIQVGTDWKTAIDAAIATADIILLLVSPDFLASDYCINKELAAAFERWTSRHTHILPVIVRPCSWEMTPIARIQSLCTDKPIGTYSLRSQRDAQWRQVAQHVSLLAEASDEENPTDTLDKRPSSRQSTFVGKLLLRRFSLVQTAVICVVFALFTHLIVRLLPYIVRSQRITAADEPTATPSTVAVQASSSLRNQKETGFGVAVLEEVGPKLKAAAIMDEQGFISFFKESSFRGSSHKLWFDLIISPLKFDIALGFSDIPNAPDYLYLIDILDPRQVSISALNEQWEVVSKLLLSANGRKLLSGRFPGKSYHQVTYAQIVGKREQLSQDLIQGIRLINEEPRRGGGDWVVLHRAYTTELLVQGLRL